MNSSNEINELAAALSALHSTISDPAKDGKGRFGAYVPLDTVLATLRAALPEHGLAFAQAVGGDSGITTVTTRVMHTSGQWLEDTVGATPEGNKGTTTIQAMGGTVTYLRRYSLMAMFGLTGDDDNDGDAPPPPPRKQAQPRPPAQNGAPGGPSYEDGSPVSDNPDEQTAYRAYVSAHNGKAPQNVHNLRNWLKSQKKAAQPALVEADAEQGNGAYEEAS